MIVSLFLGENNQANNLFVIEDIHTVHNMDEYHSTKTNYFNDNNTATYSY